MEVKIKELTTNNMLIEFTDEGHTLGNLLRSRLIEQPAVISAAYRVIHPLKNLMELSFETKKEKPLKILKETVETLEAITLEIKNDFSKAFSKFSK